MDNFFSNVLNSVVFYCSWFIKPNLCGSSDIVFKQYQRNTQISEGGRTCAELAKIRDRPFFSGKKTAYNISFGSISRVFH